MINGVSITSLEWQHIKDDVNERIDQMKNDLVRAKDPVQISRLQGGILALEGLIEVPDVVSD